MQIVGLKTPVELIASPAMKQQNGRSGSFDGIEKLNPVVGERLTSHLSRSRKKRYQEEKNAQKVPVELREGGHYMYTPFPWPGKINSARSGGRFRMLGIGTIE